MLHNDRIKSLREKTFLVTFNAFVFPNTSRASTKPLNQKDDEKKNCEIFSVGKNFKNSKLFRAITLSIENLNNRSRSLKN